MFYDVFPLLLGRYSSYEALSLSEGIMLLERETRYIHYVNSFRISGMQNPWLASHRQSG